MFTPYALVIDDDPTIRRVVARLLQSRGWHTLEAADPVSAPYYRADVVVSDWDMPNGGGARVLAESHAPVVLFTGTCETLPVLVRVARKPDTAALIDLVEDALESVLCQGCRAENTGGKYCRACIRQSADDQAADEKSDEDRQS